MTLEAIKDFGLTRKDGSRAKNMFALGMLCWLYGRPVDGTERFLNPSSPAQPAIRDANLAAFHAGWNFGETTETFAVSYEVKPAPMREGTYRNISGQSGAQLRPGGRVRPLRPAAVPRRLPDHPGVRHPARAEQAQALRRHDVPGRRRDRRHRRGAGASFGGALGATTTSGPGIALKSETIGLAVTLELPLIIVDVQRGGPSTGLPTKTEQADLLQAMFGRNGEAPVPIVAPRSPGDCFDAVLEAARIAVTYRTPVMLLSDGYLANGSEPWQIPDPDSLPLIDPAFAPTPTTRPSPASTSSGRTSATPRRWRGPGRCPEPPASSTGSVASRRPTATATSPTTRRTTT